MEVRPKIQLADSCPSACPSRPAAEAPQAQAQHPDGPTEPSDIPNPPVSEEDLRQDGQGAIHGGCGYSGYSRSPLNFFPHPAYGSSLGPPKWCKPSNEFKRRYRMKGHPNIREVNGYQPSRGRERLHDPPLGPSPGAVPVSAEGWKEGTIKAPQKSLTLGREEEQQQGQKYTGAQRSKGQRQWRSRGARSPQYLQYVWRPTTHEKAEVKKQHGQQHQQANYVGQNHKEKQKEQNERQRKPLQRVQRGNSSQQQEQQPKVHQDCRNMQQQPLQDQRQKTPNQQPQQRLQEQQHKVGEKQEQLRRQVQRVVSSRPVCVRPPLVGGTSAVVLELQRLRRQFGSTFSLLSCHPLLLPMLQQDPYNATAGGAFFCKARPLPPRSSPPDAAAHFTICQSSSTDSANRDTLQVAPPIDREKDHQAWGPVGCRPKAATGEQKEANCEPEIASSILCKFELLLTPTDPDFDTNMLPNGLRLCVTMRKSYPGAEAVLGDSSGLQDDFGDASEGTAAATSAVSVSDGSVSRPAPRRAAQDGPDSALSGQQAAAGPTFTETQRAAGACSESVSHASSSEGGAAVKGLSRGSLPSVAVLEVCSREINDLRRDAIELVFSKVIEQQLTRHEKTDLVRTAIKALDRHLRGIFELELTQEGASPQMHEQPWTEEEQRRLEEAVVLYRRVAEPTLRWRNISSHVGSRTAKECAIRFQRCRENVLSQRQQAAAREPSVNKSEKAEELHEGTNEAVPDSKGEDGEAQVEINKGPSQAVRGTDVSLIDSTTEGVSSLHLSCIQLQVTCGRCRAVVDVRVPLPKDGASLEPAGCSVGCAKCLLRIGIRVQPTIGVAGSQLMRVAAVHPIDCNLKDLLPCDFVLVCDCCGASMKTRGMQSGAPRTNHCRHCHSKITFGFQGAALGFAVVCGLSTTDSRSRPSPSAQQRQRKQDLRIVVGCPLADFGTCKHYKKSFRWLRFPCCGKAYPCDVCHDSTEDHEHEWATRMICGFCSTEQPFANGKPCTCGKALTKGGGTAHWEGGKGCRDRTRMSRKDSRKYKSVNRQQRTS